MRAVDCIEQPLDEDEQQSSASMDEEIEVEAASECLFK